MPNPKQKDIQRLGALHPQTIRRGESIIGHGPASTVHVDGDILAVVAGFHLRLDIPLVDLPAEASGFLPGPALAGGNLCVRHPSSFTGTPLPPLILRWEFPSDTAISKYQYRQRAGGANCTDWLDIASSSVTTTAGDARRLVLAHEGAAIGRPPAAWRSARDRGWAALTARRSQTTNRSGMQQQGGVPIFFVKGRGPVSRGERTPSGGRRLVVRDCGPVRTARAEHGEDDVAASACGQMTAALCCFPSARLRS